MHTAASRHDDFDYLQCETEDSPLLSRSRSGPSKMYSGRSPSLELVSGPTASNLNLLPMEPRGGISVSPLYFSQPPGNTGSSDTLRHEYMHLKEHCRELEMKLQIATTQNQALEYVTLTAFIPFTRLTTYMRLDHRINSFSGPFKLWVPTTLMLTWA